MSDKRQTGGEHHVGFARQEKQDEEGGVPRQPTPASSDAVEKNKVAEVKDSSSSSREECKEEEAGTEEGGKDGRKRKWIAKVGIPKQAAWIWPTLRDWSKVKPWIRSSVVAWLCLVFLLIRPVEVMMGNASFLILVGVFIQPAELPLVAVLEREFFTMLLLSLSWAYACIAIKLADVSRTKFKNLPLSEVDLSRVFAGDYIETAPSAICGAFLAVGAAAALYLKVKFGPSPFIFATILACIMVDITLIYAPLFPYPMYSLGQTVIVPLAIKTGLNVVGSLVLFPKSVNSDFVERLTKVLAPLGAASTARKALFAQSPLEAEFNFDLVKEKMSQAEAGLLPLSSSARLLTREVSFGLCSGADLKEMERLVRLLLTPVDGVAFYLSMVKSDIQRTRFPIDPTTFSRFTTPAHTPAPSRPSTPPITSAEAPAEEHELRVVEEGKTSDSAMTTAHQQEINSHVHHRLSDRLRPSSIFRSESPSPSPTPSLRRGRSQWHWPGHHSHHHSSHHHHGHHDDGIGNSMAPVGIWESLRYAAVEVGLHKPNNDRYIEMCMGLISAASGDLHTAQAEALTHIQSWLLTLNRQRFQKLRSWFWTFGGSRSGKLTFEFDAKEPTKSTTYHIEELRRRIAEFDSRKLSVIEPFRGSVSDSDDSADKVPYRYLYQSYTVLFFEKEFTIRLITLLEYFAAIEENNKYWRFWMPQWPKLLSMDTWTNFGDSSLSHDDEHEDEDPTIIPGMATSLGITRARNPDAMPGESAWQDLGIRLSDFLHQLFRGHSLFCIKAGAVTILTALPSMVSSSAGWAYQNKAIWVVIMSQLCIARHRGEVAFGLISRLLATFFGAIFGLLIWYIASGSGVANPYALAVVGAFGLSFLMLGRIYYPGPPITTIITCVTSSLIVGYSWKDATNPSPGSPGIGWSVAWRRFVEVLIGTTAAYIMAILPPSSTLRKYIRVSHATIVDQIAKLYCHVITIAALPPSSSSNPPTDVMTSTEATKQLLTLRQKMRRLGVLKVNVAYEWSLQGQWPTSRYDDLARVEMELSKLLSHAVMIVDHLGPAYSKALLRRIRFLDPIFLADCIAVLTMSTTALRSATPLPQIVPVLLDRFFAVRHSFEVLRSRSEAPHLEQKGHVDEHEEQEKDREDLELPQHVTFETLASEKYQTFAVGVSVAFGIVLRLDRLCMAVKALVGEEYAVPADFELLMPPSLHRHLSKSA